MNHHYYMQIALSLANSTANQTLPNPNVGAVVVRDNYIVGMGAHLRSGLEHAEVIAINQAGSLANGSTLYVTLEPCSHFGKTPPCCDLVISSGIKTVVIAMTDPNPKVNNLSIDKLRQHNIEVICGVLSDEAKAINPVFIHNITTNTPFVTLKSGLSLDGKISTHTNISKWITSSQSRTDAHQYRATHQSILVGVNTIIDDNPSLTPYLVETNVNPIRIILDNNLRIPLDSRVLNDNAAPTWIITRIKSSDKMQHIIQKRNVKIISMEDTSTPNLLNSLYINNIQSIMVEGGSGVYTQFIQSDSVNQLVLYYSMQLIGGVDAKSLFAGVGFTDLVNNPKFNLTKVTQIDNDIKIVAMRK